MLDYSMFHAMADETRSAYQKTPPFPHAVILNFLPDPVYLKVKSSFPSYSSPIWKKPENEYTQGKSVTKNGDLGKESFYSEDARRFFFELQSGLFLTFLEKLTGIKGLIGDPHFAEGGFHSSERGAFLSPHADFSHHDRTGLERRVNLLFYLNDGWQPKWEGALTLYDESVQPVKSYYPFGNSCVIFSTSEKSFHGHPVPLACPQGVRRKSIALYYYTLPTERKPHRIIFPQDSSFSHKPTEA